MNDHERCPEKQAEDKYFEAQKKVV